MSKREVGGRGLMVYCLLSQEVESGMASHTLRLAMGVARQTTRVVQLYNYSHVTIPVKIVLIKYYYVYMNIIIVIIIVIIYVTIPVLIKYYYEYMNIIIVMLQFR